MAEKKTTIGILDEKRLDGVSFAPLSQYDELAAREVEDLCRTRETLSREMKTLTDELSQIKEQLELGSQKEHLKALRAEQARHEEMILELQKELPLLREEAASFRFEFDPSLIEEEFALISAQFDELIGKPENMNREIQFREREMVVYEKNIAEGEAELREMTDAIREMEVREGQLVPDVTELKLFEAALPDDQAWETERACHAEVAALGDGLKRKDLQALNNAQKLIMVLGQKYESPGEDISEWMRRLNLRISHMQEVAGKEDIAASMTSQIEELQKKVAAKNLIIEELRAMNSEGRKMVAALEAEIHRYRKVNAEYAEEVSRGDETTKMKKTVMSEFGALFVQKAELQERVLTADSKLHLLMEMVRNRT